MLDTLNQHAKRTCNKQKCDKICFLLYPKPFKGECKLFEEEKITERNTNPPNSLNFNIPHCPKHTGLFYQSNTP